jgi:ferrous iron transport protein A
MSITTTAPLTADRLRPGEQCRVLALRAALPVQQRLMELGFLAGALIEILRRAPLGGPIALRVAGTVLSLRIADASQVEVVRCD